MSGMTYRLLGSTDLHVSAIGFGAATLGNVYGSLQDNEAVDIVHAALAAGINLFDTSPYYGDTLSEQRLGKALKDRRDQTIIATKAGKTSAKAGDFSARHIRESVHDSLTRLQTDYIDILQLHDIEFAPSVPFLIDEAIAELLQLKQAGYIRYIGVTSGVLGWLREIVQKVEIDTILSYGRYNLLDTSLTTDLLPAVTQKEIGLINASPLYMGILTESGPPPWSSVPSDVRQAVQTAAAFAQQHQTTITDVALKFVLGNEAFSTTLIGMKNTDEIIHNIELLSQPVDEGVLAGIQAILAPYQNLSWQGLPDGPT